MASVLIITFLFQVFLIFLQKNKVQDVRDSLIRAIVVLAIFIWFSTEFLSYFSALNYYVLLNWWFSANFLLFIYLIYQFRKSPNQFQVSLIDLYNSKKEWFLPSFNLIVVIASLVCFLTVLITALYFPPNTVDVLTYHLPRVAHWVQAGNVEFFPTNIDRQLFSAPFAEFSILHLQILSGNDYYANLVQFFSFGAVGIVSSLVAKRFELNQLAQLLAIFVVATLPIAILQGSSAKNDLVVSLFVCSFFYFYLEASETNRNSNYLFAGLSLGLAILTKGNAYFYCASIGLCILISYFFDKKFTKVRFGFIAKSVSILFLALIINSNHYYRNWQVFGNPLQTEVRLQNDKITVPIIYANVVRNYAIHLGTFIETITDIGTSTVEALLGNELNNPASTLSSQNFAMEQSFDEESAGNPFHISLLTISIIYAFIFSFRQEKKSTLVLALSILLGFLLLCTFLKWNIWISRIHLPLFCLGSPLIALILSKLNGRKFNLIFICFLFGWSLTIFLGAPRNFFDSPPERVFPQLRTDHYFIRQNTLAHTYLEATEFLKRQNAQEIGLFLSVDYDNYAFSDWEYNFWLLLKDDFAQKPILRHIGVTNPSAKLNKNVLLPEWVISTNSEVVIEDVLYEVVWEKPPIKILRKNS